MLLTPDHAMPEEIAAGACATGNAILLRDEGTSDAQKVLIQRAPA